MRAHPSIFALSVDRISVARACNDNPAITSENGYFVVIDLTIETSSSWTPGDISEPIVFWTGFRIETSDASDHLTADPKTISAFKCMNPNTQFPSEPYEPSTRYHGSLVLDSTVRSGILTYESAGFPGGWKWKF